MEREVRMIDIASPTEQVEIVLKDGKLWVNVDGICRLRIYDIRKEILSLDYRAAEWTK